MRKLCLTSPFVEDVLLFICPYTIAGPFSFLDGRGYRHEFIHTRFGSCIVIPGTARMLAENEY